MLNFKIKKIYFKIKLFWLCNNNVPAHAEAVIYQYKGFTIYIINLNVSLKHYRKRLKILIIIEGH